MSKDYREGKETEGLAPVPSQEELLIAIEKYLAAGVRLGTRVSNSYMQGRGFIFSVRPDGLRIFNLKRIDERIMIAAKMISRYDPDRVIAYSAKPYGFKPTQMFCRFVKCRAINGRFIPGTFTNPMLNHYVEADLLVSTDPKADVQAIIEAAQVGIPVIALTDTDTPVDFVDLMVPCNNKGRRSLALVYWLLARQVLRIRGELKENEDLPVPPEEFSMTVTGELQAL
jgi:small subunit ribosomal protein S2